MKEMEDKEAMVQNIARDKIKRKGIELEWKTLFTF
jgi:hypothetical protein